MQFDELYSTLEKKGYSFGYGRNGTFKVKKNGKDASLDTFIELLEFHGMELSAFKSALESLQSTTKSTSSGPIVLRDLPASYADATSDDVDGLTALDLQIWQDIRFLEGETESYLVKDSGEGNTYTEHLRSSSKAGCVQDLQRAFSGHASKPERILHSLLKGGALPFDGARLQDMIASLPQTALDYIKVACRQDSNGLTQNLKYVLPSGESQKLYEGFFTYESSFREMKDFRIKKLRTLSNFKDEPAIAFINLGALANTYHGEKSELWETFLKLRLKEDAYVDIFKAWMYAVCVGKNNSRQEMWLYGNGFTGKSTMIKAITAGLQNLCGKDIVVAASKDTGKSNFNAELLNKHLLVYADAKNLKSGMSEAKHNITGGDLMRIEDKGTTAVSRQIYMKCLSCSNELPQCDMSDRSQSSRYIILPFGLSDDELKENGMMDAEGNLLGNPHIADDLTEEFPKFIGSCFESYKRRCPTHSDVIATEAKEFVESIDLTENVLISKLIEDNFYITSNKKDFIEFSEFKTKMDKLLATEDEDGVKLYQGINFESVLTYLQKKYSITKKRTKRGSDGEYNRIYALIGITDNSYEAKESFTVTADTSSELVYTDLEMDF